MVYRKLIYPSVLFVTVGILVAIGIAAFDSAAPGSSTRSILYNFLFPGFIAGSIASGLGESWILGYFVAWFVNTVIYWLFLGSLVFVIRKLLVHTAG